MKPRSLTTAAVGAVALTLAAAPLAQARTAYLLPNTFNPERTRVTVQSATTEDDYFNPDGAMENPSYVETLPSGQEAEVKPSAILKDLAVTEVALEAPGTYRISTGQVVARKTTFANVGGKWLMIRQPRPPRPGQAGPGGAPGGPPRPGGPGGPGEDGPPSIMAADVPADAPRSTTESVAIAETYVSKGAPTPGALTTSGKGFELKPITHPNALYLDTGFAFQLLVDGAPVANAPISVYRNGNIYDDRRIDTELKSDAKGMAKVSFTRPGVYLLTTHVPVGARAPGEAPPAHNYTYSLTFEVTR